MDIERVKELLALLEGTDVKRLAVEQDGLCVEVEREVPGAVTTVMPSVPTMQAAPMAAMAAPVQVAPVAAAPAAPAPPPAAAPAAAERSANSEVVTSPFVGTFYRAPGPGVRPFTEVGARVKKGDVLCIVEAMKLMNEIESEHAGVVREILGKNEEAVQFGQELFVIEVDG